MSIQATVHLTSLRSQKEFNKLMLSTYSKLSTPAPDIYSQSGPYSNKFKKAAASFKNITNPKVKRRREKIVIKTREEVGKEDRRLLFVMKKKKNCCRR